ncbi:MAG: hypothetical protein HY895_16615 [Deltaproteobacteria bacterium]|nr:hypothetical protein [Deltaproteobacteria bacterium]
MKAKIALAGLILLLLIGLGVLAQAPAAGYTRVELTQAGTEKTIMSIVLRDGEQAVLTWRNSLFGLEVTEVFQAGAGTLILDEVTFGDPRGLPPPTVSPADVADLYQTGGPFTARGLGKPLRRVMYRVSEIGNPKLQIRDRVVAFKQEVGFGGAVILTASAARLHEILPYRFASQ